MIIRKQRSIISYVLLTVLFFFFVHRFIFMQSSFLDQVSSIGVYPILLIQSYLTQSVKNYFYERKSREQLLKELNAANSDKEALKEELSIMQASMHHYKEIKELIGFKNRYKTDKLLLSRVVLKNIDSHRHFILINKGRVHGVEPNMIAVSRSAIVGRVLEVFPYYSHVALMTDKSCKISAYCPKSNASGIYEGNNTHDGQLQFVSHLNTIHDGDRIFSTGEGLVFPEGFLIGEIKFHYENGLYYTIVVKPALDIHTINYCYLLKKGEYQD